MDDSEVPNADLEATDHIPTFADLLADAEIAALLDFEPVPRKIAVDGGWTPENQREFIARLAVHGSACKACDEMGKNRTGVTKLFNHPQGASFRAAWKGAVALAKRRREERGPTVEFVRPGDRPPTVDHRFRPALSDAPSPARLWRVDPLPLKGARVIAQPPTPSWPMRCAASSSSSFARSAPRGWPGGSPRPISTSARSASSRWRGANRPLSP